MWKGQVPFLLSFICQIYPWLIYPSVALVLSDFILIILSVTCFYYRTISHTIVLIKVIAVQSLIDPKYY